MRKFLNYIILVFFLSVVLIGCNKKKEESIHSSNINNHGKVRVVTCAPMDVTDTEAIFGAEVHADDNYYLSEIGVCWDTLTNPTISSNYKCTKYVDESFSCTITNLINATMYYVRAYALYDSKYYYGEELSFYTDYDNLGNSIPVGALRGLFSVSEYEKVYFSKGNLQYQASTNTWRFAEKQWNYIGQDNENISSTYDGWIDLFGWGTSGWNSGNTYYRPYNSEDESSYYGPYGQHDLYGLYINSDWGYYNPIANGGNLDKQWHTLKKDEWDYLLNIRNTNSGIRFAKARVNDVNGLIIVPDNWRTTIYELHEVNDKKAKFESNIISPLIWDNIIQTKGAVFIPASGYRERQLYYKDNKLGCYWSTSCEQSHKAYMTNLKDDGLGVSSATLRSYGFSIRLVQNYK